MHVHGRQVKNRACARNIQGVDDLAGNGDFDTTDHRTACRNSESLTILKRLPERDGPRGRVSGCRFSMTGRPLELEISKLSGVVCFFALAPQALSEP